MPLTRESAKIAPSTPRQRRLVQVNHRAVFGTLEAVKAVLVLLFQYIPGAHWHSTGKLHDPGVAVPLLASSPLCFHRDAGAMAIKIRTSLSLMFSRR